MRAHQSMLSRRGSYSTSSCGQEFLPVCDLAEFLALIQDCHPPFLSHVKDVHHEVVSADQNF